LALAVTGSISLLSCDRLRRPSAAGRLRNFGNSYTCSATPQSYRTTIRRPSSSLSKKKYPDITVEYVPGDNAAKMLGTLRSEKDNPRTDVVIMDTSVAETGVKEGLFDELTPETVPERRKCG
jgi:putative spermidine/putrescine transport system substrate-binding protein